MLANFVPAAVNLLILLGGASLLSGSFDYLRRLSRLKANLVFGSGFAALAVGSMLMAFPIAPGVFGDYRNAIVAVAALVGGPVAAIIAAVASCAMRIWLTPAMAAGVSDRLWEISDIVKVLEAWEART